MEAEAAGLRKRDSSSQAPHLLPLKLLHLVLGNGLLEEFLLGELALIVILVHVTKVRALDKVGSFEPAVILAPLALWHLILRVAEVAVGEVVHVECDAAVCQRDRLAEIAAIATATSIRVVLERVAASF